MTQGTPPTPRFHHSCDAYDGGLLNLACIVLLGLLLLSVTPVSSIAELSAAVMGLTRLPFLTLCT